MSRAARVSLAIAATLAFTALALIYPWIARGDAWIGASWQNQWLLLPLVVVPFVWYWGTFGQDTRKPHLRVGTIAPLLVGPRGIRAHLRDIPGVIRAVGLGMLILAM